MTVFTEFGDRINPNFKDANHLIGHLVQNVYGLAPHPVMESIVSSFKGIAPMTREQMEAKKEIEELRKRAEGLENRFFSHAKGK